MNKEHCVKCWVHTDPINGGGEGSCGKKDCECHEAEIYGDGHYCTHHPDDPAHGKDCYPAGVERAKIERCGFCGSFFRDIEYLTAHELNTIPQSELDAVPLGYCPNAQEEAQSQETPRHQVTRDMAIDAGDPALEGQWI